MKIHSIQYLRGLAAMLVLMSHNSFLIGGLEKSIPGALGVDIFFIISGFIIAFITSQHYEPPLAFAIKRFFRIWPCLFVVWLLATTIVYKWNSVGDTVCTLYFCLKNFNSVGPSFGFSPLGPPWTLTYEIAFYTIFMFSMIISYRYRVLISSIIIFWLMITLQLFFNESFSLSSQVSLHLIGGSWWGPILKILSNSIFIEFIIGMSLYEVLNSMKLTKSRRLSILCLSGFFISSVVALLKGPQVFGVSGGMLLAMIIVSFLVLSEYFHALPNIKFLSFIGDISYSVYLVHFPIMIFLTREDGVLFHIVPHSLLFVMSCSVSIAVAYLLNLLIEKPSMKLARNLIRLLPNSIASKG